MAHGPKSQSYQTLAFYLCWNWRTWNSWKQDPALSLSGWVYCRWKTGLQRNRATRIKLLSKTAKGRTTIGALPNFVGNVRVSLPQVLKLSTFLVLFLSAQIVLANPFHHQFVCVPKINPSHSSLEFVIRDDSNCKDNETWFQVYPQKGGVILLFPSGKPLPITEQNDLEEFKKYHSIGQ